MDNNNCLIQNNSVALEEVFESDEDEIAAASFVVFASCHLMTKRDQNKIRKRRTRRVWVREWLQKRQSEGAYMKLLQELRFSIDDDRVLYKDFLRMSHDNFIELLDLVEPIIEKKITNFRMPISAAERLALTLHYLATGNSYRSLQFLFRIPQCTISMIIPEVLDAIWTVLKNEYIRVSLFDKSITDSIMK